MYLDSNVFIYAAMDKSDAGAEARALLKLIREGRINAAVSPLVLDEVMWTVQKSTGRECADLVVTGIMALPLSWLDTAYSCIRHARAYYLEGLDPRDAFHAGVMKDYSINEIVSEDVHFDKIKGLTRISIKDAVRGN